MNKIATLRDVLLSNDIPWDSWLYLPEFVEWHIDSRAFMEKSEEVPPEEEDLPKAGYPIYAIEHELMQALDGGTLSEIIENAKSQLTNPIAEELFGAFIYYYDNDAFLRFK